MWDSFLSELERNPITQASVVITILVVLLGVGYSVYRRGSCCSCSKNLRRNRVRTSLTFLATTVLVFMVIMIWTVLNFIEGQTTEKSQDFKLVITERWQLPSRMRQLRAPVQPGGDGRGWAPPTRSQRRLSAQSRVSLQGASRVQHRARQTTCCGASTAAPPKRAKITKEKYGLLLRHDPRPDQADDGRVGRLANDLVDKLKSTPEACLLGDDRLAALNLKVGDTFRVYSINYKDVDLDFKIVGRLPGARYATAAIMNYKYFNNALDKYYQTYQRYHPMHDKRINLICCACATRTRFKKSARSSKTTGS